MWASCVGAEACLRALEASALADYEQRRNEAARPIYDLTCQLAALEPPPAEMQQLFGALLGNQADTKRFLGVVEGTTPVQEFFAPENLGRIISASRPPASVLSPYAA